MKRGAGATQEVLGMGEVRAGTKEGPANDTPGCGEEGGRRNIQKCVRRH